MVGTTWSRRAVIGGGGLGMVSRLIDPTRDIERAADAQHGVITQRELRREIDQAGKLDAQSDRTQRTFTFETLSRYFFDVPSNTDSIMGDIMVDSASTITLMTITDDVPLQCRIAVLRVKSTANVSAGTLIPVVRVYEDGVPVDYAFDTCELSAGDHSRRNSAVFDWPSAIQIAKNNAWQIIARTDAAFVATTADVKVDITFQYEQWI